MFISTETIDVKRIFEVFFVLLLLTLTLTGLLWNYCTDTLSEAPVSSSGPGMSLHSRAN